MEVHLHADPGPWGCQSELHTSGGQKRGGPCEWVRLFSELDA